MNRKVGMILCTIIYAAFLAAVYAGYTVWSNSLDVTVSEYTLTLQVNNTSPYRYSIIAFNGTLQYGSTPVSDATVKIWRNETLIGTPVTDSNGKYLLTYNVTDLGVWRFRAGFDTP